MATIGPYHTTLPHITKDNWRDLTAQKREKRAQLIPVEWRLAPDLVAQAGDDVTGVAEQSGILSARELEITDLDEVKEVRVLVMSVVASPCGFEKVVVVRRGIVTENPRFPFSSVSPSLPSALQTRLIPPRKSRSLSPSEQPSRNSSRTASPSFALFSLHLSLDALPYRFVPHRSTGLTEIFFKEAIEHATELDKILAKTGKPVGPLR